MDIQAYISSGVLESYVLGELSASEARQVEEMAARYPEVKEELQLIEETLEAIAKAAAVTPHKELRTSILDQITSGSVAPAPPVGEAPVRPLHEQVHEPKAVANKQQPQRWLMAASISLAVISSLAALFFWNRWQQTEQKLASLVAQNTVLVQHVSTLEKSNEGMQQTLAVLTNPSYEIVPMDGLAPMPDAQAVVYWNPSSAEVFLNVGSLPVTPAGKQYQLWAIVDGKPVNAGVFDVTGQALKKMRQIQNASAFAVTLEPAGGSATPTMEQMCVIGNVS